MSVRINIVSIVLFLLLVVAYPAHDASGQPNEVALARERLLGAFQSVQNVDLTWASASDTRGLVDELNDALANLKAANETGDDSYATLSSSISLRIMGEAQASGESAEEQTVRTQVATYSSAVVMGALSSLFLVDLDMLESLVRRRKPTKPRVG